MLVVYFSSVTENTHRFVQKLGLPSARIPLHSADDELVVHEPYVLVSPTYGGGALMTRKNSKPVPTQVIRFLNNQHNRGLIRAVAAGGDTNFGSDFCRAGDAISRKLNVPYVYRFELMGNEQDVKNLKEGLVSNMRELGLTP